MQDLPNFQAWNNENLANFAIEAYHKMQQQQEQIEHLQRDFKDAMIELRKFTNGDFVDALAKLRKLSSASPVNNKR